MSTMLAARSVGTIAAVADDDRVLGARLCAGDDHALAELYDRYSAFVMGVARRVTRNVAIAEEVAQDVFTSIWTAPERFDAARGTLRAYLGVLTYRRAVDAVRSETRRRARESQCAADEQSGELVSDALDSAAAAECVREAIACLPDAQRIAVELAFFHGHTYRDVAVILAIPEGTAKSRLRLAQAKLGTLLASSRGEHV